MGIKITIKEIVIEVDVKEGIEVLPSIERTSEDVEKKLNAFEKRMENNARAFAKTMNEMVVRKDNGETVVLKKKDASTSSATESSATTSSGIVVKKEEKKPRKTNTQKNEEPYTKEEQKARKKVLMQRYLLKKKGELTKVEAERLDALLADIDEKKRATYEFK